MINKLKLKLNWKIFYFASARPSTLPCHQISLGSYLPQIQFLYFNTNQLICEAHGCQWSDNACYAVLPQPCSTITNPAACNALAPRCWWVGEDGEPGYCVDQQWFQKGNDTLIYSNKAIIKKLLVFRLKSILNHSLNHFEQF